MHELIYLAGYVGAEKRNRAHVVAVVDGLGRSVARDVNLYDQKERFDRYLHRSHEIVVAVLILQLEREVQKRGVVESSTHTVEGY